MTTTSDEVQKTALRLFAQRGYQATTMREIARELGLTVGALYYYEPTKEDILMGIMESGMARLLQTAEAQLACLPDDPLVRLTALVGIHVRVHGEQQLSALVSDTELRSLSEANRKTVIAMREQYEQMWRRVLEDGYEQGAFSVDPVMARLALLQMCTGVAYWYSPDGARTLDSIADEFATLACQMVGARQPERS